MSKPNSTKIQPARGVEDLEPYRLARTDEFSPRLGQDFVWEVTGPGCELPPGSFFAIERRTPEAGELAAFEVSGDSVQIGRYGFQKGTGRPLLIQVARRPKRAILLLRGSSRSLGVVVPLDEFRRLPNNAN
jgi:hypothetical protein